MDAAAPPPARIGTAALWMVGAILSFSAMAVAGREVSAELDTFELMTFRSAIGLALVAAFALATGRAGAWRTGRPGLQALRNVFHFTGQNLWFHAVAVAPLAQVIAIEFTSPLWVALLAPFLLGERLTALRAAAVAAGFGGVLLVAAPWQDGGLASGAAFAALAAIGFAATGIATKVLTRTEPLLTILLWLTGLQLVFGIACAGWDGDVALPSAATWPWVVTVGLCGLLAHLSLTRALTLAPASVVMPIDFARLPLIAALGAVLYREGLPAATLAGAAVILAANWLNLREAARR